MIYLDYNATTPVAPEVARAMQPFLGLEFGNPSSDYPLGLRAAEAMGQARREVAALLNCARRKLSLPAGPPKPTTRSSRAWPWAGEAGESSPQPANIPRCWPPAGSWSPGVFR